MILIELLSKTLKNLTNPTHTYVYVFISFFHILVAFKVFLMYLMVTPNLKCSWKCYRFQNTMKPLWIQMVHLQYLVFWTTFFKRQIKPWTLLWVIWKTQINIEDTVVGKKKSAGWWAFFGSCFPVSHPSSFSLSSHNFIGCCSLLLSYLSETWRQDGLMWNKCDIYLLLYILPI